MSNYLRIIIDGKELDLPSEDFSLDISYRLENPDDFQVKQSSTVYQITVPATPHNDAIFGTMHNMGSVKLFPDEFGAPKPAAIEVRGMELFVGKAFLVSARHTDKPISYSLDFYGNNADWKIELEETTLWDILKDLRFTFDKATVQASWVYNGRDPGLPYVFAPVRYLGTLTTSNDNMEIEAMRPSLSLYYLIEKGLRRAGYRLKSDFMNTDYFRRMVMPWTWGNFLFSGGTRIEELLFLAKSSSEFNRSGISQTGYINLDVSNDSTNGGFDNSGTYSYDVPTLSCNWTYLPAFDFGVLEAGFYVNVFIDTQVNANSDMHLQAHWFKNGVQVATDSLKQLTAPPGIANRRQFVGAVEVWQLITVQPGDVISLKFHLRTFDSNLGRARVKVSVDEFSIEYFRIPVGGRIDFTNFAAFKKHKWLDLLRGVIDLFNLSIQTDPVNKVVVIEPTHSWRLPNGDHVQGYFNEDYVDMSDAQDLSIPSDVSLMSNAEREFILNFKDDGNDGLLKIINERNNLSFGEAKYVFPSRFKSGKKTITNRFFSPLMHYDVEQWQSITGIAPQMPVIVPENISNTSRNEAQNTFQPKVAHYKGNLTGVGGWRFDGEELTSFPFMFAVNYKPGGETDPVLSYSDERIGTGPGAVLAPGLLRSFYLQRFAIMRNGRMYETHLMLKSRYIAEWYHREHVILRGQRFELISIENYNPLKDESTKVQLRHYEPKSQVDGNAIYPSKGAIILGNTREEFDTFYTQAKALFTDIPQ